MQRRSPARYLAPIALVAVIAGTYVVVHNGLGVKSTRAPAVHRRTELRRQFKHARFYTVAPGENLTSIAKRTGLPVGALETLNPGIDPNSLQTGQRLRLRR
ncbi:MAG TPA: LysM domain-containing protein [Solirubrobacteraceae bacterium]|nr:LysM domain-containing protein [Solirubrobacteraceae bacterium]